jgi:hypothetical protein
LDTICSSSLTIPHNEEDFRSTEKLIAKADFYYMRFHAEFTQQLFFPKVILIQVTHCFHGPFELLKTARSNQVLLRAYYQGNAGDCWI